MRTQSHVRPMAMIYPVECGQEHLRFIIILFLVAEQGKLATGEIPLHDGEHLKWIHRILMGAYLLITNVLLINLLIAIFRYHVLY